MATTNTWDGAVTGPNGEIVRVQLTIDARELLRKLGPRAAKAKGGKSTIAWGLVKVKVTQRLPKGGAS